MTFEQLRDAETPREQSELKPRRSPETMAEGLFCAHVGLEIIHLEAFQRRDHFDGPREGVPDW